MKVELETIGDMAHALTQLLACNRLAIKAAVTLAIHRNEQADQGVVDKAGMLAQFLMERGGQAQNDIDKRTAREAPRTVDARTQAADVRGMLALWASAPNQETWRKVIEAAEAYDGERVPGTYFTFKRPGGAGGDRSALGYVDRIGKQGARYERVFRKGSKSWTKPRSC